MPQVALTVHFHERYGAYDRIVSLLRRRGFPVSGMTLESTHQPGVSRMTVMVAESTASEQVGAHLAKLPDVRDVTVNRAGEAIQREFALLRVCCPPERRQELQTTLASHGAWPISSTSDHVIVEGTGSGATLDALFAALTPFGIEESARTSSIALQRESHDGRHTA